MLERTAVLVDTSYLLASFYNSWETGARAQLSIDLPEVVHILGEMIQKQLHQPIHRQYWYDGIPDSGPHRYQRALRTCEGVILRTGQLIEWGDRRTQKAVDTRLVADMVLTAVHQTVSDIVLVSGDADMIPGVEEATNAGIRVHLYGFGWDSMSSALRHVCDSTTVLDPREDFTETMQLQVLEGPVPPAPHIKPVGDGGCPEETGATPLPPMEERSASPEEKSISSDRAGEAPEGVAGSPDEAAGNSGSAGASIGESSASSAPAVTESSAGDSPSTSTPGSPAQDAAQAAAQAAHTPAGTNAAENFSVDQAEQAANRFPGSQVDDTDHNGLDQNQADHASLRPDTRAPQSFDAPQQKPVPSSTTPAPAASRTPTPTSGLATPGTVTPGSPTSDGADSTGATSGSTDSSSTDSSGAISSTVTPNDVVQGNAASDTAATGKGIAQAEDTEAAEEPKKQGERPKPSMMAPRRKLRSRYVPLPNEVWTSAGAQTPFDVGQQYAAWWFDHAATQEQRDQAHMLSGGGLPPEVDRPLLQFACETLHEYTLSQSQRVDLRDGFHSGIRGVLISFPRDE